MKRTCTFFLALSLIGMAEAQINTQLRTNALRTRTDSASRPVRLSSSNTGQVALNQIQASQYVNPGQYIGSTPFTTTPPNDPARSNVQIYYDVIRNSKADNAQPKYYMVDADRNGNDWLLAFGLNSDRSMIRLGRASDGIMKQTGAWQMDGELKHDDELLFGNFSERAAVLPVVVDRRSRQFWHYGYESGGLRMAISPYAILSNWAVCDKYLTGDFNGDGRSDILGWNRGSNALHVALYVKPANNWDKPMLQAAGTWLNQWAQSADMDILVGDFNGDRKDDVALVHKPSGEWRVAVSTGTAFQPSWGFQSGIWLKPWAMGNQYTFTALDVDNDGRCDIVAYDQNTKSFQVVSSNGTYFDHFYPTQDVGTRLPNMRQILFGKVSGEFVAAVIHMSLPDPAYLAQWASGTMYVPRYRR